MAAVQFAEVRPLQRRKIVAHLEALSQCHGLSAVAQVAAQGEVIIAKFTDKATDDQCAMYGELMNN